MSLVGTRPPTVDEWDKYELHHRARLATKPGLTGMWQVSGRSNITDLGLAVESIFEVTQKVSKLLKTGKFFETLEGQTIQRQDLQVVFDMMKALQEKTVRVLSHVK